MVQGRQVRQLDRGGCRDDPVAECALGIAELSAHEGQQWTHPFAARDGQVTRQFVCQVARRRDGVEQTTLDDLEPRGDTGLKVGNMKIGCLSAHGISMTIFSSRLNTGPGNTPRAMVPSAHTTMARADSPSDFTTTDSSEGSVKNMTRTRRK